MPKQIPGWIDALWFIPATAINVLIWKVAPCAWSRPYC